MSDQPQKPNDDVNHQNQYNPSTPSNPSNQSNLPLEDLQKSTSLPNNNTQQPAQQSAQSAFSPKKTHLLDEPDTTIWPNDLLNSSAASHTMNDAKTSNSSHNFNSSTNNTANSSHDTNLGSNSGSDQQTLLLGVISHHLSTLAQEMRVARRGRWLGRILLWLLLLVAALLAFGSHFASNESMITHNHTAVIEIKGEIAESEMASADNIKYSIQQAFENEYAKGIILRINSPGGSPVQAGMIYDEIMRQKQKYPKKRVYAVVEEICASGAYYIAAAADYIYVDKASIVGSIGVLMDGFGFDKTMEKFGVQRRLYTAGTNKGMLDPFSPENPKQKEHILKMLDSIHQQFIAAVKKGRGSRLKAEQNPDIFTGLFWTGEKSIELGLSDGYSYVNDVADRLIREKQLVDYTMQEDFTDKIAKRFGAQIGSYVGNSFGAKFAEGFFKSTEQHTPNTR